MKESKMAAQIFEKQQKKFNFLQRWKTRKQIAFLIASDFVIHPQIFIFSVFKIASLSPHWLQIKFSMSLFFHFFTFAINLWHWKFVTVVFVNNQHGIQRRGSDFDKKFVFEGYTAKRLADKFPDKAGQSVVLISCWKVAGHRATKRYRTTTGSLQSHRHFIEEHNYAFVGWNISNILLTHKYTQHTQLHA